MLYYHSVSDFAPGAIKKMKRSRDGYNFCVRYKLVGGCLHCARKREKFISADSSSPVSHFVISRTHHQLLHFRLLDYEFPGLDFDFIVSNRPRVNFGLF